MPREHFEIELFCPCYYASSCDQPPFRLLIAAGTAQSVRSIAHAHQSPKAPDRSAKGPSSHPEWEAYHETDVEELPLHEALESQEAYASPSVNEALPLDDEDA